MEGSVITQTGGGGYALRTKAGLVYGYAANGKLTQLVDRNGNATTLSYDPNGLLVEIADASGRLCTLGYDPNGKLVSIAGRTLNPIVLVYAGDQLTRVQDSAGNSTQHYYDADSRLERIVDAAGTSLRMAYYRHTDVVLEARAPGAVRKFDWYP